MVAVTAKNTSFDEDLTIVVVKQVLLYNFKMTFRAHFIHARCRNVFLHEDVKLCLGFLMDALETATKT